MISDKRKKKVTKGFRLDVERIEKLEKLAQKLQGRFLGGVVTQTDVVGSALDWVYFGLVETDEIDIERYCKRPLE